MMGKTCMITGATSGIGRVTALALAAQGADLVLLCRNRAKGHQLIEDIQKIGGRGDLHLLHCDLSSLSQVQVAAEAFLATGKPLHVLVNNAGVFNLRRRVTADGLEEMFAVNYLAHFLLTLLVLPRLQGVSDARVVNVGSGAHRLIKRIRLEDLTFERGFRPLRTYSHSKLANGVFNTALAQRLGGSGVTANVVDPGEVATNLGGQNGWVAKALQPVSRRFLSTPEKGAATSVFACTSDTLRGVSNAYLRGCEIREPSPQAMDRESAEALWEASVSLVEQKLQVRLQLPWPC